MSDNKGILDGIRVIEASTFIFGPATATILAEFGAEVIKMENPVMGDPFRYFHLIKPMPACEMEYYFILEGRNRKGLAMDLGRPESKDVMERLIQWADVFITNYHPSITEKLGLTYEIMSALNDRLIYAHASGFGDRGRDVEKPGYDATAYWARSGLMDSVSPNEDNLAYPLPGMGDHPSATALFGSIMLALYDRERTGKGRKVKSSLMANGAWSNASLLQGTMCDMVPYEERPRENAYNALINHYFSKDGRAFLLVCLNAPKDWEPLCKALGRDDLACDPRFQDPAEREKNTRELIAEFDAEFAKKDIEAWRPILDEHDITYEVLLTDDEFVKDPDAHENEIFVEFEHPKYGKLKTIRSPINVEGETKVAPTAAPGLGEHSREILAMLGYGESEIEHLHGSQTVKSP